MLQPYIRVDYDTANCIVSNISQLVCLLTLVRKSTSQYPICIGQDFYILKSHDLVERLDRKNTPLHPAGLCPSGLLPCLHKWIRPSRERVLLTTYCSRPLVVTYFLPSLAFLLPFTCLFFAFSPNFSGLLFSFSPRFPYASLPFPCLFLVCSLSFHYLFYAFS